MDLSIIIVNWNSAQCLKESLSSIYCRIDQLEYEVIVVDNASFDGCQDIIANDFPQTRFIQSDYNIGFARANNLGFTVACGRHLLFLNPDTKVIGAAIETMNNWLDRIPKAGAVGCRLLNKDLTVQINCIQSYPRIIDLLLNFEALKIRFPKLNIGGVKPLFLYEASPSEVEVISGACLMVTREAFQRAGHFSTEYFMYTEDIDLCYKIDKVGFKKYYVGDAEIIHYGGGSTKVTSDVSALKMRQSALIFLKKTRGKLYCALYRIITVIMAIVRVTLLSAGALFCAITSKKNKYLLSVRKWRNILSWALGISKPTER